MKAVHTIAAALVSIGIAVVISPETGNAREYSEALSLPSARSLHGAVVWGHYLFVVGGQTAGGFTSQVDTARINADGTLSPWFGNTPLPLNLVGLGNSVVAANDTLYVCGGQIAFGEGGGLESTRRLDSNAVYFTRIGTDGKLDGWRRTMSWPGENCRGVGAATNGRFLYVVGGAGSTDRVYDSAYFAELLPDGSLGPWQTAVSLPTPLLLQYCFTDESFLYAVGGRTASDPASANPRMFRAKIFRDGSLGQWETLNEPLAIPCSGGAGCRLGSLVFLFGGRSDAGDPLSLIQYTRMEEGRPTGWRILYSDFANCLDASVGSDPGRRALYLVGGQATDDPGSMTDRVLRFVLPKGEVELPPPVGNVPLTEYKPVERFRDFQTAMAMAKDSNRFVFVFCMSPVSRESRDVWDRQLNRPRFLNALPSNVIPAYLDVQSRPDMAQRLGIHKIPAYAVFNPKGDPVAVSVENLSMDQVLTLVRQYAK